jgi:hypothetical protein
MVSRFLAIALLLLLPTTVSAQEQVTAFGCSISYQVPDAANWQHVKSEVYPDKKAGLVLYKHKGIKDDQGRNIIPNMAIIYERLPEPTDAIRYSIAKRIGQPYDVKAVRSWQDGFLTHKSGVGYEATYNDPQVRGLLHKVFVAHMVNEQTGVQVICDCTEGVFPKTEADMRQFVKSVTFTK